MIQRKQTVFLLLALILTIICLCLSLGNIEPKGMGVSSIVYNLGIKDGNGVFAFSIWPLFALLLLSCPLALTAIFSYKNRLFQARLCVWTIVFNAAWYLYAGYCWLNLPADSGTFKPSFTICLPLISMSFYEMARRGIMKDERLVRAADRIR